MIDEAGFSEYIVSCMPFRHLRRSLAVLFGGMVVFCLAAQGEPPHIDLIERYGKQDLLLHFATDAFRAYELQYTFKLVGTNVTGVNSNNPVVGGWTNLYMVPRYPFPNHYVVADTNVFLGSRTNSARYYRLRATP